MNDEQKEYIVTEIERYDNMSKDATKKIIIDYMCIIIFVLIKRISISGLPDNLEMYTNQVLGDVSLLGILITIPNLLIDIIKNFYSIMKANILSKKINKEEIEERKQR